MLLMVKVHGKANVPNLESCKAVLDQSLDPVILGLHQNLLQVPLGLWQRHGTITQEVEDYSEMAATAV